MQPLTPLDAPVPTRTILVVDDDEQIRGLLRMWFAALGFEVVAATGGGEALALLGRWEYDVVICDLFMPNMTGDELFRLCRERWPEAARHFVFLSGGPRGLPAVDFAAASGQPCLPKPCRLAEIQMAIEQVCSRSWSSGVAAENSGTAPSEPIDPSSA